MGDSITINDGLDICVKGVTYEAGNTISALGSNLSNCRAYINNEGAWRLEPMAAGDGLCQSIYDIQSLDYKCCEERETEKPIERYKIKHK